MKKRLFEAHIKRQILENGMKGLLQFFNALLPEIHFLYCGKEYDIGNMMAGCGQVPEFQFPECKQAGSEDMKASGHDAREATQKFIAMAKGRPKLNFKIPARKPARYKDLKVDERKIMEAAEKFWVRLFFDNSQSSITAKA